MNTIPRTRLTGFTLIELMIAVAILGILASLAAPAFTEWLQTKRIESTAETLRSALQTGRAIAIERNQPALATLTYSATGDLQRVDITLPLSANEQIQRVPLEVGQIALIVTPPADAQHEWNGGGASQPFGTRLSIDVLPTGQTVAQCVADAGQRRRCLRVEVSGSGRVRTCNLAAPAGDAAVCD